MKEKVMEILKGLDIPEFKTLDKHYFQKEHRLRSTKESRTKKQEERGRGVYIWTSI